MANAPTTASTAVRERPILFSGPMVRAILDGRKTQTRRVILPQPQLTPELAAVCSAAWESGFIDVKCPYGVAGDRLWVRETFYCDHAFYPEGTPASCYWDGSRPREQHTPEQMAKEIEDMRAALYYRADGECCAQIPECDHSDGGPARWRPSIHMPRWASRLTLEITGVRVERLQEITNADAIAEGVWQPGSGASPDEVDRSYDARDEYRKLWDSLNAARGFGWDANPWVWVIAFKAVQP